ncbi:MAG: hypothetical protein ABEI58_03120 [Candidatus Nanohaloarchaea archaeon]
MNVSGRFSRLKEILVNSFQLLRKRPVLFVPKLFSTGFGALWVLGLLEQVGSPFLYMASMPLIVFVGAFVSVMVAGMVREGEELSLRQGFWTTVHSIRQVLGATFLFLVLSLVIALPASLGYYLYLVDGASLMLATGALLTLVLTFAVTFVFYFFPITLLEGGSVFEGYRESRDTSVSNSAEVLSLTLFSFVLLAMAFFSQGTLESLGYAGFVLGRLTSGLVTTYIFVVSPKYYLES